jgi:hypothetical protein
MSEAVQKAREPADACDAIAQLEDTVTLVPRDAIPTVAGAVADRIQRVYPPLQSPGVNQGITPGMREGGPEPMGRRHSLTGQTGQDTHSPELCTSIALSRHGRAA